MTEAGEQLTPDEQSELAEAYLLAWREQVGKVHPQRLLMRRDEFSRFLRDRGLHWAGSALAQCEKYGALWPAALTPTPAGVTMTPGPATLRAIGDLDQPILPGTEDAWDCRADVDATSHQPARLRYYHPFQAIWLRRVEQAVTHRLGLLSSSSSGFWQEELESWSRSADAMLARLRRGLAQSMRNLALLAVIEDLYLPEIRGVSAKNWHPARPGQGGGDYPEWRDGVEPKAIRNRLGVTVDDVRSLRETLASEGRRLDPNESIYILLRAIPYEERRKLRGSAQLAWDYYEAAEILGLFLGDLTGQAEPHVDDVPDGGWWKTDVFGVPAERMDYSDHRTLAAIARRYGLDGQARVLWIVEGDSEKAFLDAYAHVYGLDLAKRGVVVQNMKGINNTSNAIFPAFVRQVREWQSALLVTVDCEKGADEVIRVLRANHVSERSFQTSDLADWDWLHGTLVWHGKFEKENFDVHLLFEAWVDHLGTEDSRPTGPERLRLRAALDRLIAEGEDAVPDAVDLLEKLAGTEHLHYSKPGIAGQIPRVLKRERQQDRYMEDRPIETVLRKVLQTAAFLRTGRVTYEDDQ